MVPIPSSLRMFLLHIDRVSPDKIAVSVQPCIEKENFGRWPEAVVGGNEHGVVGAGIVRESTDKSVNFAEVLKAPVSDLTFEVTRRCRKESGSRKRQQTC